MKRRTFLKGIGGITVLVVGGGVWRAYDQGVFSVGQGPAYEPWKNWRTDANEGPLTLVRAAILAASPHNTQPWIFKVEETRIELYADTTRNLGTFDPYLREMYIGLGCALENMALAAVANGYKANIALSGGKLDLFQDNLEPMIVAEISLSPGKKKKSSLYDAIPLRHTNRGAYDSTRELPSDIIVEIERMYEGEDKIKVLLYTSDSDKEKYIKTVIKSTEGIIKDATMVHDSQKWFRLSWSDVQEFRDGPTVDAFGVSPLLSAAIKMLPPPSAETNHQQWLDVTRNVHLEKSQVFGLIMVRDLHDQVQNLRTGRSWQRLHLWATTKEIAMHPINQSIEMVDREMSLNKPPQTAQVLADLTGDPAWKPTFSFRMGYPIRKALESPRRAVEDVVVQ